VIPIALDGTKRPWLWAWKGYKERRPTEDEVRRWFSGRRPGLGVIGGKAGGGLEALDFDNHLSRGGVFLEWATAVPTSLLRRLVIYRTPGDGWRVCWRTADPLARSKEVLARRSEREALVELLSACVNVVPGGNPRAHQTGKPYRYAHGHLADTPTIAADERQALLTAAGRLNRYEPPPKIRRERRGPATETARPERGDWWASDDFIRRASWEGILEPHGWERVGGGEEGLWLRPGKYHGVSATTNYRGLDLLHVFSSSTPFRADTSYNKFAAYAILNFRGDFSAASKQLARLGYGRANDDLSLLERRIQALFTGEK
jgi:putative DNA primase/helicase